MDTFLARFQFHRELAGQIGIEREWFLTRDGRPVPLAPEIVPQVSYLTYELSACQIEATVGPSPLGKLPQKITEQDARLRCLEQQYRVTLSTANTGWADMPLDIYPDERYRAIVAKMPPETLSAACRIIGTHVHVGMPDYDTARQVYRSVIRQLWPLCALGDLSDGKRLALYCQVAPTCRPPDYDSAEAHYRYATEHGFAADPRSCWHLIRISRHGTIEFRMFGATASLPTIMTWCGACYALCLAAL